MTGSRCFRTASILVGVAFGVLACGGHARGTASDGGSNAGSGHATGNDAGNGHATGNDAGSGHATGNDAGVSPERVPAKHRAAGVSCAQQRAAVNLTPMDAGCSPPDSGICQDLFSCSQDSDCTNGDNGRCGQSAAPFRDSLCSYDECFSDTDCSGNAPCECRAASSSAAANTCLSAGNCRIDADCGAGGYCSPSVPLDFCFCPSPALCGPDDSCSPGPCSCGDSCGHGYFCHTRADTCLDDSDCGNSGSCNYDTVNHYWSCSECWAVP